MTRTLRAQLAQETLKILNVGRYTSPAGATVMISAALREAVRGTVLYLPEHELSFVPQAAGTPTQIVVANRSTLEAAHAMCARHKRVAALNFASAKHPGGGFLAGAQAQEESLARATGLYACLKAKFEFYAHHRDGETAAYSDRVIFSPDVPVFRDDAGALLETPWTCSLITAAAVNAAAIRQSEPEMVGQIDELMARRARKVLAVAALHNIEALVLGAWGCGVFQNDPQRIAVIFRDLLRGEFAGTFARVEFAVLDREANAPTLAAFVGAFEI